MHSLIRVFATRVVKSLSPAQNRGLEKGGEGGGAPCMKAVKRELWFASPAPGDHLYSFGLCWEADSLRADWEMRRKWKGCEDKRAKEKDGSKEVITLPDAQRARHAELYSQEPHSGAAGWSPRTGNTSESKPSSEITLHTSSKKRID